MVGPHSPWHSPVPYLFGGLAAMLGLIAFALLILACSYWRLSGYLDGEEDQSRDRDPEAGDGKPEKAVKAVVLPEKFLVIMAGDVNPTYLATPVEKPVLVTMMKTKMVMLTRRVVIRWCGGVVKVMVRRTEKQSVQRDKQRIV
ncbi:hypothetical protein Bca52824_036126 [Brassica carinata]|uniref:Uncharacterized protein n=1 Tax=Brassica carinata TaxID=52824 RepID=A0A8X7V2C4_BRACI|nr:hypothetical protein Bca52824_036126 [Brassica carinata]